MNQPQIPISQIPSTAPTHVYLLQVDQSINICSNDQVLHLLDTSLEYQNCSDIPLSTKIREDQNIKISKDSCQQGAKIIGYLLTEACQNIPNTAISATEPHIISSSYNTDTGPLNLIKTEEQKQKSTLVDVNEVKSSELIKNYVQISDRNIPPRALAVLPDILKVQKHQIIAARRTLPIRTRFGPVQGVKLNITQSEAVELVLNSTANKMPLFLVKHNHKYITHIDVSDKDKANWISLLPLGSQESANVWLYEENQELYTITTEAIPSRKPLMLGYSKKYADTYGLVGPTKDIESVSDIQKPWWCNECQRAFPSANLLRRHTDMYHKDGKLVPTRKSRCKYCSRTFSRIFTLRRHINMHCLNKNAKRNNTPISQNREVEPQINLNSICTEDNRISSDESFQNYSNGLDFSTNLFDTDRMPNLDISSNSRSENDFNPYAIGYKEDNGLTNELPVKEEKIPESAKQKKAKQVDQILVTCPYCNQVIIKEKKRLHVSECPARRFECECKKVFTNKSSLEQHIFDQHSNEKSWKTENVSKDNGEIKTSTDQQVPNISYKCEQCQFTFKRRGMLVNHLWRTHKTISTRVPLERRVRHYPCVVCPKIYRTANKRDQHVLVHHPGAEKIRGQALEGGTRLCEPAMCSACPRQYATRSKLLQHQRAHHPYLVPLPPNKNNRAAEIKEIV